MNDKCGICLYWGYMGYDDGYEEDEGFCYLTFRRTKQNEICDSFEIDPLLLEE